MFEKYCHCDLKTQAFSVAVLYLIGSSVSAIAHIIDFASSDPITDIDNEKTRSYSSANGIALSVVVFVVNGLLLYGVLKENRFLIIPWLVLHGIVIFLLVFVIIIVDSFLFALLAFLLFGFLLVGSWYTIWKYFRTLNPHDPYGPPTTAAYVAPQAATAFTNDVADRTDTVVFTPSPPPYGVVPQKV